MHLSRCYHCRAVVEWLQRKRKCMDSTVHWDKKRAVQRGSTVLRFIIIT